MKKFKFRLENVLKVRTIHKKMAERDVMTTNARLNKNRIEQEENQEAYGESTRFLAAQTEHTAFWQSVVDRHKQVLSKRRESLKEQEEELVEKLDIEKKILSARMKDERTMERLKEHQRQAYMQEADMIEQAEMEEIDILKRGGRK